MGTYVSLCEYCTDVKWVLSVAVWFLKKSLVLVASVGCWYHVYVCMYVCQRDTCTDFFGGLVFEKKVWFLLIQQ